jgi:hypothetical protein
MQWNLKKTWLGLAAPLAVLTTLLNAADNSGQIRNLENRVTALEQRRGQTGLMNPPANPTVKHGDDLFLFGDLLYWTANQGGMPLGVVNDNTPLNLSNAKITSLKGQWNFGSRVGIGYVLPHDGWDLDLSWLHFNTGSHRKVLHSNKHKFVFPSIIPGGDPLGGFYGYARKASGKWSLYFNQLDLDLGRDFFVSRWLTLRPHGGIRGDWLRQGILAKFKNFSELPSGGREAPIPPENQVKVRYKDRWWGVGLESGIDTQWNLGAGWSIFCDLAGAILWGRHNIRLIDKDKPPATITDISTSLPKGKYAKVKEQLRRVAHPILDLALGLRWDWKFDDDRFHLGLQAGWENHVYFSQNQFPFFPNVRNRGAFYANQGDLTFQGWTFGALFEF